MASAGIDGGSTAIPDLQGLSDIVELILAALGLPLIDGPLLIEPVCWTSRRTQRTSGIRELNDRMRGHVFVRLFETLASWINLAVRCDAIRTARLAADFSLRDLTKRVSVTPSYLSDIENDRRVPSQEVLSAIAAVLQ